MGYGGWLIYSSAVENAKKAFPDKKIIVIYPIGIRAQLQSKKATDAELIFSNNPNIFRLFSSVEWMFYKYRFSSIDYLIINFGDKNYYHYEYDTDEHISYKKGKHAIEYACEPLNIKNPELKPRLYLTDVEMRNAEKVLHKHNLNSKKYICIEPGTKSEFTPNKAWPETSWNKLYEMLETYIKSQKLDLKIVQIGSPETPRLKNSVYLNGQLTFRETSYVLNKSIFLLAYIGGLTHLARASDCTNIVLKSAWEPKELTSYPGDSEFYTDINCKHCGLKTPCPFDIKCMKDIAPENVYATCIKQIRDIYL